MANADSNSKRAATGSSLNFNINDHSDVLIEILTRLHDHSLGVAACVCRLWCSVMRNEAFWEMLCFREVTSPAMPCVRQVVVALGGYKKMYMLCVRRRRFVSGLEKGWTRDEVQLWLSLFCVDCYERLGQMRGGGGDGLMSAAPSLMFLSGPVNV